jgi:ubiquinone/menaquinone biosynthesis C-methylase UbiE
LQRQFREDRYPMGAPHKQLFDLWSHFYDVAVIQRATYHPVHDAVVRVLARRPPRAILDVACGTGQLGARLREAFPRSAVVGCDFSAGMLQHAVKRDGRVSWVRADAARLPFADGSFDALTCTEAFHWFPAQDAALAEFNRVLASGGRALIALVNPRLGLLSDVTALGSRLLGEPFYWPTAGRFRRALSAAGLRTVSQRSVGRLPGAVLFPAVLSVARKGFAGP